MRKLLNVYTQPSQAAESADRITYMYMWLNSPCPGKQETLKGMNDLHVHVQCTVRVYLGTVASGQKQRTEGF